MKLTSLSRLLPSKKSPRRTRRPRSLQLELRECRALMSVSPPAIDPGPSEPIPLEQSLNSAMAGKTLRIDGTNRNDDIDVFYIDWGQDVGKLGVRVNNKTKVVDPRRYRQIEINGLAGDDTITNATDIACTIYGGDGHDEIDGGSGNDHLYGDDGDDVMCGGKGKDYLYGGAGNDMLFGDRGNDHLYGEDGNDWLFGGSDDDYLVGGKGDDNLSGEGGDPSYDSIGLRERAGRDKFFGDLDDRPDDFGFDT